MKRRLTVTLDAEILAAARLHARSHSVSLSSLVEQSLRKAVGQDATSFTESWRGRLQATRRDERRYEALARKYLTSEEA